MAASEETIQEKRDKLVKLQEQIEQERYKRLAAQEEASLALIDTQLDAQIAAAQVELEREKRVSSKTAVKESIAPQLDAAKDDVRAAAQVAKAEEKLANKEGN